MKKIFAILIIGLGLTAAAVQYPYYRTIVIDNTLFIKNDDTDGKIAFRDNSTDIQLTSSADRQLDIDADTEVEIATTTFDINAAVDISGIVTGSSSLRGSGTFTTTAQVDTTLISGLLATDIVLVTGEYVAGVDQQDVLQAEIKADTLIVHRLASGESAAAYNYLILR